MSIYNDPNYQTRFNISQNTIYSDSTVTVNSNGHYSFNQNKATLAVHLYRKLSKFILTLKLQKELEK